VIRISNGKYLIGTDSKMASIRGNSIMVRVGGGWEKIDEYILRNQDYELTKLDRIAND
jgi:hypothetical protein